MNQNGEATCMEDVVARVESFRGSRVRTAAVPVEPGSEIEDALQDLFRRGGTVALTDGAPALVMGSYTRADGPVSGPSSLQVSYEFSIPPREAP